MSLTLQSLAAEMQPFHNDICIVHDYELGRLLGVAEDEHDFYYIVAHMTKGIGYYSAVGRCVSLRGHYPDEAYHALDGTHAINKAPKGSAFELRVMGGLPVKNSGV